MSIERDLTLLLKTVCPRVFADVAKTGTLLPFVTWQLIGGESLAFIDNTAGDKRNSYVQINVWADSRTASLTLARQIEDALRASDTLIVTAQGELMALYESDTRLGTVQRFSIWAAR